MSPHACLLALAIDEAVVPTNFYKRFCAACIPFQDIPFVRVGIVGPWLGIFLWSMQAVVCLI